jgi:hypothetical protein
MREARRGPVVCANLTRCARRRTNKRRSAFGGKADNKCSARVFPLLTQLGHRPAFQNAQSLEFGILHNRPPALLIALDETRKFSSVYCLEGRDSDCFTTRTEIGIFLGLAEVRA